MLLINGVSFVMTPQYNKQIILNKSINKDFGLEKPFTYMYISDK